MEIRDNNKCFVCGSDNERGLKLSFKVGGGKANTEFISPPHLQGYDGILHGGIISTILDEVMVKATGEKVVTVELTVKFLKPIPTGKKIIFHGRVSKVTKKIIFASSEAKDKDGNAFAIATGKYFRLDY